MNEQEKKLQAEIDDQYKRGFNNIVTEVLKNQEQTNDSTSERFAVIIKAFENQEQINDSTSERFAVSIEAFENQGHINESNRKTIAKHAESIRWLYCSNVALIIALVALLLK